MVVPPENPSQTSNVFLVLCFLVFSLIVSVTWDIYKKRNLFKFSTQFNGPTFFPVIGHGYHFAGQNILTSITQIVEKYHLPCNLWLGHSYNYVTANAAEVKVILNHPATIEKNEIYNNFNRAFKDTILLAKYDVWKKNRKLYSKSFSQTTLNTFVDIFYKKAGILVEVLKQKNSDMYGVFDRFSLDNFCTNIMAMDLDVQFNLNNELTDLMARAQAIVGKRMVTAAFFPSCLWELTREGKEYIQVSDGIKKIIGDIIQKKRNNIAIRKDTKGISLGDDAVDGLRFHTACLLEEWKYNEDGQRMQLIDVMLEAEGTTFTDDEIFHEILLFLLAATDTSAITLLYTFTLLGMNPEIQENVYQEIIEMVGIDRPITYEDLPNLKYTERAIFEAMRLLPVTPILGRQATADVDIGDTIIPAGANIIISLVHLHRNEEYWKNPLEYNPDRFLPEEAAKRNPYAHIPFSGGPRNCIGMKYAIMLMKTAVAQVMRHYRTSTNYKSIEDMKFVSCITMKTVDELDIEFIPRALKS